MKVLASAVCGPKSVQFLELPLDVTSVVTVVSVYSVVSKAVSRLSVLHLRFIPKIFAITSRSR